MSDKTYIRGALALILVITVVIAVKYWLHIPVILEYVLYGFGVFLAITGVTIWYNRQQE